jgi:hypothetical protein
MKKNQFSSFHYFETKLSTILLSRHIKNIVKVLYSICILLLFNNIYLHAQCSSTVTSGQNLVTNGDFSSGYTGWTYTADPTRTNGYEIFDPPNTQNFSVPGFIYAGSSGSFFNSAFANFNDHTPTADNMMLMVDGICVSGVKLWSQSNIPLSPNTNYYFSVWVHAMKDGNNPPGTLQFDINGVNLATTITAPTDLATGWIQYEIVWNSGATPPATATISIENTTLIGCNTTVDFAIDDITFIPGCAYGAAGPQPNLGPDKTLCGTGGSVTIDANVPHLATTTVTWWDGVTNTGSTSSFYTRNITLPGTYSVCVSDNGSCVKSDVIVITNTFSVSLGPNMTLCSPSSATLDAGYSGTGVTYKWYKNGTVISGATSQTYFVNTAGTYKVDVTDPVCGVQSSTVTVTSNAATPNNGTYCSTGDSPTVSVTGTGTYKWYDTPTKGTGTLLASGSSYTTPALTAPTTYTYYVEDVSSTAGSVGPTIFTSGSGTDNGVSTNLQQAITITQDVQITSLKIPFINCNTSTGTITIEVRNSSNTVVGTFTSDAFSVTSANNNTLVPITFTNFNLLSSWGSNLRLDISTKTINATPVFNSGNASGYPFNGSPTGIISSPGAYVNSGSLSTNNYCYFYDIHFLTGVPCDRVPVVVTNAGTFSVNLGPDIVTCSPTTLDAGYSGTGVTYKWYKNGTVISGATSKTYLVNAAGTYKVDVTSPLCGTQSGSVNVTAGAFSINLGPNITLCSPSSGTLDAGFSGTGVTYIWYNNGTVISGATSQTYFVNTAGTYKVDVTSPLCGVQSGTVTVTSNAATPNNGTYCSTGSTPTVSVTGTGTYNWYDTPTKGTGTLLASGSSYTTPALTAPNSYTYYVEDVSATAGSVGPTTFTSGSGTDWGVNTALEQAITITQDVQITSLKIPFINCNTSTGTITIEVRNSSNTVVGTFTSDPFSVTSANNNTLVPITFTNFKLLSSWGSNLRLDVSAKTINASHVWNSGNASGYPFNGSPTGIISSPGAYANSGSLSTNNYCYFYDIHFQTGVACDRVPVVVTNVCGLPVAFTSFTANENNGSVFLNWQTAAELNSDHFVVERSEDGVNFSPLATIKAAGKSNSALSYSYTDKSAYSAGTYYYRIVEYDIDGAHSITPARSVSIASNDISIKPNPSNGNFTVSARTGVGSRVSITIVNPLGQTVYQSSSTSGSEVFEKGIDISSLPAGIYIFEMLSENNKWISKISKE